MADLSGASSLAALVVAGENDRMGATNDGVDFIYGALNDSPRASVLIRNASHCFVAVPPSITDRRVPCRVVSCRSVLGFEVLGFPKTR